MLRRGNRCARAAAAALLAVVLAGCASSAAMRAGRRAEQLQEYDRAIIEYSKVLRDDPDNQNARRALERMRLRASLEHLTRGRRLAAGGRLEEAVAELQIAAELNPTSADIGEALTAARTQLRNQIVTARDGKTELETLIERARSLPPIGEDLPTDVTLPTSLVFPDASARVIYTALAKMASVNIVFDPQFRDQLVTINLTNPTLEGALQAVSNATRNFYRVTGQRTITIVPDTPAKRREYEEEIVQPFFLSNADAKEVVDLLRIVIDARRLAPAGANVIAVKDTAERIAAAGRLIEAIDKARPEVVIDVEILEVDRTRFREFGLQLASPGTDPLGVAGGVVVGPEEPSLRDLRRLNQSDVVFTNLPGLFYRLLKTDTNTRTLANTQLRSSEGMPAQARFGEEVPIPVTTFSPIAQGGLAQQPVTSFQYRNIGVNIDITPRTHHDDDVSLSLKLEVSSLSGAGFGGLPTFGNRSISTVLRLRDGETNLLAGLIRDDEREVVSGVPGLSDIPLVGRLFAHNRRETQATDIVLTLTPRIIRVLDLKEDDLRAFRVGRDGTAGPLVDLPVPPQLPQPEPAAPQPQPQQQQPAPPTIGPIFPTPAQPPPNGPNR
jgi:general secretion pathway protein D